MRREGVVYGVRGIYLWFYVFVFLIISEVFFMGLVMERFEDYIIDF